MRKKKKSYLFNKFDSWDSQVPAVEEYRSSSMCGQCWNGLKSRTDVWCCIFLTSAVKKHSLIIHQARFHMQKGQDVQIICSTHRFLLSGCKLEDYSFAKTRNNLKWPALLSKNTTVCLAWRWSVSTIRRIWCDGNWKWMLGGKMYDY